MSESFSKFQRAPVGFLLRALYKTLVAPLRYRQKGGYDAARYWHDRFTKYGMSLKGVGDEGLTEEENKKMYEQAASMLFLLCKQESIDFAQAKVLEIGCGNGFYTQLLWDHGVRHYVGVDITDVFFSDLAKKFPGFKFVRCDITADTIDGKFDLILMIDVIEHIVDEQALNFAITNVQNNLATDGLFLVAPIEKKGKRSLFYVRFWSVQDVKQRLISCRFSDLLPFRYSHLLAARKMSHTSLKTERN